MDLASARRAVAATLAALEPGDKPIAIVVADGRGEPVYAERMDGATANDLVQAERKAYTAAFMERSSRGWRDQIREDGRTVADWSDANLTTLAGGAPIGERRAIIGSIGVHGNSPVRDEQLAWIGAEAALTPAPRDRGSRGEAGATSQPANGRANGQAGGNTTQTGLRRVFNLPGLSPAGSVAPDLVQV